MTTRIRLAGAADAAAVREIYAPWVETTAISFELVPPTVEEMASRIVDRQPAHPWLVAEDSGEVLGYAYAGPFAARAAYEWAVESSVYVAEASHGRRVGTALYVSLLDLLTAQGYRRVLAGIALPHAASVALHEKLGFTAAGVFRSVGWKLDGWHDVGWWQRDLGTGDGEPARPLRTLDELPASTLADALAAGAAFVRPA